MAKIIDLQAYEILDSRGIPALNVTINLEDGTSAKASTATEFFTPQFGAKDIWDHDEKRFHGNGLLQVIKIIESVIKPKLIGLDSIKQQEIDKLLISLDPSINKNQVGANTLICLSMVIAKATAKSLKMPLFKYLQQITGVTNVKIPTPIFTIIDGGKNANYVTDIQEFFVIPASFKTYRDALALGTAIHANVADILRKENILPFVGEKGGLGPLLSTNEDALSLISQAFDSASLRLGYDAYIGIDCNANSFFKDKHYKIKDKSIVMTSREFTVWYSDFLEKYHILYFEDPMADDDLDGWMDLYNAINQNAIISGDYFTATNPVRLQMAAQKKALNGIVIKPSFVGTVSEALAVALMGKVVGLKIIVSDRTGETDETFLADFAVAIGADYVRFGAPVRGERVIKYNRLLEIEKLII